MSQGRCACPCGVHVCVRVCAGRDKTGSLWENAGHFLISLLFSQRKDTVRLSASKQLLDGLCGTLGMNHEHSRPTIPSPQPRRDAQQAAASALTPARMEAQGWTQETVGSGLLGALRPVTPPTVSPAPAFLVQGWKSRVSFVRCLAMKVGEGSSYSQAWASLRLGVKS